MAITAILTKSIKSDLELKIHNDTCMLYILLYDGLTIYIISKNQIKITNKISKINFSTYDIFGRNPLKLGIFFF